VNRAYEMLRSHLIGIAGNQVVAAAASADPQGSQELTTALEEVHDQAGDALLQLAVAAIKEASDDRRLAIATFLNNNGSCTARRSRTLRRSMFRRSLEI
jgi:hypothetical protein